MAINIQQFRQKAQAGDATRLEVDSAGTDLHRKGLSSSGRAVEWIRDAAGLRAGANQKVMHAFVAALKDEYGSRIGSIIAGHLSSQLDGGGKPLSARTVQLVLDDADRLQAQFGTKVQSGVREILARDDFQAQVADLARDLGVPSLAHVLAEPTGAAAEAFTRDVAGRLRGAGHAVNAKAVRAAADAELRKLMIDQLVSGGHAGTLQRLPADPKLARDLADKILLSAFGGAYYTPTSIAFREIGTLDDRAAAARLIDREIGRLGQGNDGEKQLAKTLHNSLQSRRANIPDPQVRLNLMTRERDPLLAAASAGGSDGAWKAESLSKAASLQNNIVTHHLKQLGAPLMAQSKAALQALAERSPELAAAMADLDAIECQYVAAMGGDPGKVNLGWADARDQLAEIRTAARELAGSGATGSVLQAFIAAKMWGLTATLFEKAAAVLGPPPGQPPVGFAVLSLGSMARGETSPYSDIEFAILLDQPRTPEITDYMRRLSQIVCFQVDNLGENGGNGAPTGFHWDGGGNSPVEQPGSFIGSADELIRANLGENWDGRPEQMFGLTMFTNPELLYGSAGDDTDWTLTKDLQAKVATHFQQKSSFVPERTIGQQDSSDVPERTIGQTLGGWAGGEAARFARSVSKQVQSGVVDVKDLSRVPMLLAQGLALDQGILVNDRGRATTSTLMRLTALAEAKVLTREEANTLADAIATFGRVRVEAHLHAGKADDKVHLDPANAGGGFAAPELRAVIDSLLPFVERIERYRQDPTKPF